MIHAKGKIEQLRGIGMATLGTGWSGRLQWGGIWGEPGGVEKHARQPLREEHCRQLGTRPSLLRTKEASEEGWGREEQGQSSEQGYVEDGGPGHEESWGHWKDACVLYRFGQLQRLLKGQEEKVWVGFFLNFYFMFLKIFRERRGREREKNMGVLFHLFMLSYVPWLGSEPSTLAYQNSAPTNWAT